MDLHLLRREGHVCCRISELDEVPPIMLNAKNVPLKRAGGRRTMLRSELLKACEEFEPFSKLGVQLTIEDSDLEEIWDWEGHAETGGSWEEVIVRVTNELKNLVRAPLDHNLGDTVIMCPVMYTTAMYETFVKNEGYVVVEMKEEEFLTEVRRHYEQQGLTTMGKWNKDGKLGRAYVLPKHKDVQRFRPICPTYDEPFVSTCKLVASALNGLIDALPANNHFNLKLVSQLKERVRVVNRRLNMVKSRAGIETRSFDIKDMFSTLPHGAILSSVRWLLEWHGNRGRKSVSIKTRGKGVWVGKSEKGSNGKTFTFAQLMCFVEFDLQHCYTQAAGTLLKQEVGNLESPWGKAPTLR
ncbi:hypothetical protein CBR_g30984 [Chara braunii]|uniref:Uncharacterized protein n=1 Tax=Chara braunii TaxID=69332 RepID=A0A388LE78_CHABU|nr:hypothetical protein CBR_g30984 [Chara braunii]|eukprot:GBG80523.1 hypothetical protein CBR_g30984 [Chara braunii]